MPLGVVYQGGAPRGFPARAGLVLNHLQTLPGTRPAALPTAPEYLGLALILCGILALVISIWQYRWSLRYLWSGPFAAVAGAQAEAMQTPVLAVAVLLGGGAVDLLPRYEVGEMGSVRSSSK